MPRNHPRATTVSSVSSLNFSAPKRTIRVLHHRDPPQVALMPKTSASLPCFVRPESEEASKLRVSRLSQQESKSSSATTSKSTKSVHSGISSRRRLEISAQTAGKSILKAPSENITAWTAEEALKNRVSQLENAFKTKNFPEPEQPQNVLDESVDSVLQRLVLEDKKVSSKVSNSVARLSSPRREHKPHCSNDIGHTHQPIVKVDSTDSALEDEKIARKVSNSVRRLSSPHRDHKPHCSNDVGHQPAVQVDIVDSAMQKMLLEDAKIARKASVRRLSSPHRGHKPHCSNDVGHINQRTVEAAYPSKAKAQSMRKSIGSPTKSTVRPAAIKRKVQMDPQPNFSRVDVRSAITESSELLKEVKSWYKELERDSSRPAEKQEVAPIRRPTAARRADFEKAEKKRRANLEEDDLRTDIESLRKEVKRLTKKIAHKSDKKRSNKHKSVDVKENRPKSRSSIEKINQYSKNVALEAAHYFETESNQQNQNLTVRTLQDLVIRRPLSFQSGPRIVISPKPVLSRVSNVQFATFEHQLSEPEAPKTPERPLRELQIFQNQLQTRDEQVSTDQVVVFSAACQTSPPQVFNIFAQTEEIVVRKRDTMVSVAVQSSPEAKILVSDLQVQTEVVQVRTVATETIFSPPPVNKVLDIEPEVTKVPNVGPAGDSVLPQEVQEKTKNKEPSRLSGASLSPILEVSSSNASPDFIVSPLTTPKASLVIPDSSKSDQSESSPEVKNKQKHSSPPKTVAFADLPLLLRLRSPSLRVKLPDFRRRFPRQDGSKSDSSESSSDNDDETVTKSNEPLTSEIHTSSESRSASPTSTASSIEFTTSSSAAFIPKAPIAIPAYQMKRIRSLAAKMAPKLLEHSASDDGELSEGQVWPLPNKGTKKI
ncbi:uncharacterized protein LOC132201538 [Neocloeon triangulifer]|uniref:uncharacterized protein LOC132201538 n=1 Tax=Neocloeon triangulifer TaxID=2078957 RepID=UPI00286ED8F5|nr:uncharacterized protein LOC132201538 [Neocloeon triangulifer]